MLVDIAIPALGESITEGTVTRWYVAPGDAVEEGQALFELETDKVSADVPAPARGVVREILAGEGTDVAVGAVAGRIDTEGVAAAAPPPPTAPVAAATPVAATTAPLPAPPPPAPEAEARVTPAARRAARERGLDVGAVPAGRGGRVTRAEVLGFQEGRPEAPSPPPPASPPPVSAAPLPPVGRGVRRVPMTRLRRRIAERLKEVQNTAAILTTFNEIDMSAVMGLRQRHGDAFQKEHGVKLGFMSFFVKAAVEALKEFPALNGGVDGNDVVYHDFYDIGVAVSTDRGLVVPVLRDADRMSFAEVEKEIGGLSVAARDGGLTLEQLEGGTFSITNGGVFGSLLSTPILNPPQSGILGMHSITRRPVALDDDRIEVRPVMMVALSYDHRIVDGAQAVRFLVRIKRLVEDPVRLLLEV
ncbi:2-oxoglutarate dehydrogenase complex dihydrolipoyllysine-residue succinyltransferase [Myxococcota bacterium]|nr:2-oxoglutarate dehydrogenase complex dihydrolipoyllysine-residue succinyltransferase [Myxococcota bacterium]